MSFFISLLLFFQQFSYSSKKIANVNSSITTSIEEASNFQHDSVSKIGITVYCIIHYQNRTSLTYTKTSHIIKKNLYLHAEEILEEVNTASVVQTWFTLAGTNIDFTSRTSPSRRTFASVLVNAIHAFATIHAWFARTVVNIVLKMFKYKS